MEKTTDIVVSVPDKWEDTHVSLIHIVYYYPNGMSSEPQVNRRNITKKRAVAEILQTIAGFMKNEVSYVADGDSILWRDQYDRKNHLFIEE